MTTKKEMPIFSVEMLNVCKCFEEPRKKARVQALRNLSFSCQRGHIYGLIGPNGSGKTTCLRILSGILHPDSGIVRVAGVDLSNDFDKIRRRVGYVSTTAQPYNHLTPIEFLFYCGRLAQVNNLHARVNILLRQFGIERFQNRTCGELSTGMKQRVAIARSLIHDPDVLIFDEPTIGLDMLARRDILDLLATIKTTGKTIILSTHIPEEAERLCDYLMFISEGRLLAEGMPCELLHSAGANNLEDAFLNLLQTSCSPIH